MEFQTCHSIGDAAGTQKKKEKPTDWASNQMSTFRVVPPMCAGNKQRTRPHVWNFQGLHRQGRKEDSLTRLPIYKHANAIRLCWQPANQFGRQWRRSSSKFVSCRKEENLCVQNTERRSRCCHRVTASLPEKWVFGSVHSSPSKILYAAGVLFIIDGDFLSLLFNMKNGRKSDEGLECQRLPFP